MKAGDKVSLVGFGTFSVVERGARMGINPSTKKPIEIAAKKVPKQPMILYHRPSLP